MHKRSARRPNSTRFLRTMEASRGLARKSTTMVLPADSPLFGVLFDSNYFNGGAAGSESGDHVESRRK